MSNDVKVVATSDPTKPSLGMRLTCLGSAPIGSPLDARDHALMEEAARALRTAWSEVRAGADLTSDADAAAVGGVCFGSPDAVAVSLDAILADKLPSVTEPVKHTLHAAARSLGALYAEVARVRARRLAELETPVRVEVVAAVILRDAKVLLVVSKKHGDTVTPGGRVEPGETHEDAIRREVREETGLTVTAVGRCLGMEQRGAFSVHFYVTEVAPGEPVAGDDAASVRWGEARETKDRAWVLEAMVDRLHNDLRAAHMAGRFLDAHAGKMRASLRWGEAPSPEEIEAHAKAHPYVVNRECGEFDCTDPDCAEVPVGAWLVRTRHKRGWCDLWHVTAWVHPDHGGFARCASSAWPDEHERILEEFGRGVLKGVVETNWIALDRNGNPTPRPGADTKETAHTELMQENARLREQVAWLAYRAHESTSVSEGMLASALELDRVATRELVDRGRDADDRMREERVARAKARMSP